ncbi:MAG: hypothetical protein AAF564_04310 [Bacteroidota bacterium]
MDARQPGVQVRKAGKRLPAYTASQSYLLSANQPALSLIDEVSHRDQSALSHDVQDGERDERGYALISFDYDDDIVMKEPVVTLVG